MEGRKQLG
jgi:hypothetical protein